MRADPAPTLRLLGPRSTRVRHSDRSLWSHEGVAALSVNLRRTAYSRGRFDRARRLVVDVEVCDIEQAAVAVETDRAQALGVPGLEGANAHARCIDEAIG